MTATTLLLATLLGMFAASWLLVRRSPVVAATLGDARPATFQTLDGLRGLLACAVLVHHAAIARATYFGVPWSAPADPLHHFAGNGAVALFFMITGLLFWDKALSGRLRFGSLLRSRLRRILPLQVFCGTLVALLCVARGDAAPVDPSSVAEGLVRWFGQGLLGVAQIQGVPTTQVDAGVTWSLTLEWLFYLALVPLAIVVRTPRRLALLVATMAAAAVCCRQTGHLEALNRLAVVMTFAGGMLAAHVARHRRRVAAAGLNGAVPTLAVVASVVAIAACYHRVSVSMLNLLLIPAFVAIALGNDLCTLLRRRSLRWLGHVSFSVYLLHGIVLVHALRGIDRVWPIAQWSEGGYALLTAAIGAVVVGIASASYLLVERAFFDPLPSGRWAARLGELLAAPARRPAGLPLR